MTALVVGVGGFLGAGEKDVIVPFTAVKNEKKNDKWYLTLDESHARKSRQSFPSAAGAVALPLIRGLLRRAVLEHSQSDGDCGKIPGAL